MADTTVVLSNQLGLHARAAAKVVRIANEYPAPITITRIDILKSADARSILELLELGAKKGSELMIRSDGDRAEVAVEAIAGLIRSGFGEN